MVLKGCKAAWFTATSESSVSLYKHFKNNTSLGETDRGSMAPLIVSVLKIEKNKNSKPFRFHFQVIFLLTIVLGLAAELDSSRVQTGEH